MNIEDKLDEDFLFYLGFTSTVVQKLNPSDIPRAQQWLQKLCGEACTTISQKRNRNIFLSNLLLDLQEQQLTGPFTQNPDNVSFDDAGKYFQAIATDVVTPEWVNKNQEETPTVDDGDNRVDGRTYVATRAMPGGEGAFAYVAVSMSDEPMWLGGGEGVFDKVMEEKHKEYIPKQHEMELILSRRKDAHERQRVITFYQVLLQNIADELDGKISEEENSEVNGLMRQMVSDLQRRGEYEPYSMMEEGERRMELLLLLYELANRRKTQTQKREEILDQIGEELNASFFESTGIEEENKYDLPAAMWEFCISRPPNKKTLDVLRETYPEFVNKLFLELLANLKEEIAQRMHRRHVNIISQMKQDLKNESEKLRKGSEELQQETNQLESILKEVRAAFERQQKSKEEANMRKKGGETDLTSLYNEMRQALLDTQASVEKEAERGHFLAEKINAVCEQTDTYQEISDQTIRMTEESNIELMKNIKRLRANVKMHENQLNQIQKMQRRQQDSAGAAGGRQQMFLL